MNVSIQMIVRTACLKDIPAWNTLAGEVEVLFGAPMAWNEAFQQVLRRKIGQGLALCVREADGPPGASMCGGAVLLDPKPAGV